MKKMLTSVSGVHMHAHARTHTLRYQFFLSNHSYRAFGSLRHEVRSLSSSLYSKFKDNLGSMNLSLPIMIKTKGVEWKKQINEEKQSPKAVSHIDGHLINRWPNCPCNPLSKQFWMKTTIKWDLTSTSCYTYKSNPGRCQVYMWKVKLQT